MALRHNAYKILIGLTLLGAAPFACAQSIANPNPVQYIVSPENPGPNATVFIEVQGVGSFLGDSTVTWQVNGKTAASGIGIRTFSFRTGGLGTRSTVSASIDSKQYGLIEHTFTFTPSLINLVWEADTTVPPFYRGKALASPGSSITVYALPQLAGGGKLADPSTISFQWKLNGQPEVAASGVGRSSFDFQSDQLQGSEDVSVTLFQGGASIGEGDIVIPLVSPLILFYVHDPLRGILYNSALQNPHSMTAQEETLRAEPFFFSVQSAAVGELQYSWQLNGSDTSGPLSSQGELTLRQSGSGKGSANVSVSLQNTNPSEFLQQAQSSLSVAFGGSSGSFSSFFGL